MPTRVIRTRSTSRATATSASRASSGRGAGPPDRSIPAVSSTASALATWAITRALVAFTALAALSLFPIATPCGASCHLSTVPLLDAASRWDGGWYLGIAREGYGHAEGAQTDLAFFPLYPALMRAIGMLGGSSDDAYLAAGVLVSNAALLVAVIVLGRLVTVDHEATIAAASVALLLVFPTTVIFSAVYAESLFLLCAVAPPPCRFRRSPISSTPRPTGTRSSSSRSVASWRSSSHSRGGRSGRASPSTGSCSCWRRFHPERSRRCSATRSRSSRHSSCSRRCARRGSGASTWSGRVFPRCSSARCSRSGTGSDDRRRHPPRRAHRVRTCPLRRRGHPGESSSRVRLHGVLARRAPSPRRRAALPRGGDAGWRLPWIRRVPLRAARRGRVHPVRPSALRGRGLALDRPPHRARDGARYRPGAPLPS